MNTLNVGVVGMGWVAGAHIQAFQFLTGAKVTAVCSRRNLKQKILGKQFETRLKLYSDYEKMLADPTIDIIDICTPHPFHSHQAIAAARAGKHLIIEKPIALNYQEAKEIRDVVRQTGVRACVCFELRFSQQFTAIRSLLDAGMLGEIHYGEADYFHAIGPWYKQYEWNVKKEFGGSSLLTAGCHALDALLFFMGSQVEEVTAYNTRSKNAFFGAYEYETTTVAILKFKGGKVGKVTSSIDCLQPYYFHVHLIGSEGSVLDNRFHSEKLKGTTRERWSTLSAPLVDSGDVNDHPYKPQFQAFVESIRNDRPMPSTDIETSLQSHRVVFAADLSASEGRPVLLAELG